MTYYLTIADLHVIAQRILADPRVRDHGLLHSALTRPAGCCTRP